MQLEQHTQTRPELQQLIQTARYWRQLDGQIKALLPENLRPHLHVACIEENFLVIHAALPMAASRLKMLLPVLLPQIQQLDQRIRQVRLKVRPHNPPSPRVKNFRISPAALEAFRDNAGRLAHHPSLAEALRRLVRNHGGEA